MSLHPTAHESDTNFHNSRDEAKQVVGDLGNQAVRDHLARALENCKIKNVRIVFEYCNLDQASVQLLANALEKNTCIGEFTCWGNPFNYPNDKDYDPSTDESVKRAIIASRAPITKWNYRALPQDAVQRRALFALLRGQRVRRLPNPLRRLPVEMLRLVGAMLV